MNKNFRKTCYEILYSYEKEGTYLNLLIKDALPKSIEEDRGVITEIVYGVIRYKLYLDSLISKYSKTKIKKLSLNVLTILRIAFYEIYFLNSKEYAIINENVNVSKKYAYKSSGFINGILRNAVNKKEFFVEDNIKYSFPDYIFEKIKDQYGDKANEIFEALNKKKNVSIRENRLITTKDELKNIFSDKITEKNGRLYFSGNVNNEYFKKGYFSVSGISSQGAVEALDPRENETVLDCCSAPGGKTSYIAEIMNNTGKIVATELHSHRCDLIKENMKRLGITNVEVFKNDMTAKNDDFLGKFDRVICDVPCSGWGVIGNKPDIKWQQIDYEDLKSIQKKILKNASLYVKDGGILVYSTCTVNKEENENIINEFLKENNYKKEPFKINIDGEIYGDTGEAVILPGENKSGFYICKMKKVRLENEV